MTVEFSDDAQDFVRRDWAGLVAQDPSGTFFHLPKYLKLYWEEFGEDVDLLIGFVEEAERTAGAVAFECLGKTLRFLGGTEVTDYMGPVAERGSQEAVAKELMAALAADARWTQADFRGVTEDSAWLPALREAAAAQGLWAQVEEQDVAPYLALPGSWDEYLEALPSKLRHEIRRKERKLAAEPGGYRVTFATEETLGGDLERFVALHRSSEGPKGKFMQPGMELFFRRLGEALLSEGVFRLAFVELNGERVAGAIGFKHGKTFYLYNSAFDDAWRNLSPGMVLVGELIRIAIEEGCQAFDMLKGDLVYKYRFGAQPRKLMRLQLARRD